MPLRLFFLLCWLAGSTLRVADAQEIQPRPTSAGAQRETLQVVAAGPIMLRPFIINGTERLWWNGAALDSTAYRIDFTAGVLELDTTRVRPPGQLIVAYSTFPFRFEPLYREAVVSDSLPPAEADTARAARLAAMPSAGRDPFGAPGLQRSGSITRGIVAGNNRDVSVESGLRMQLAGEIVDGVEVQAVLTDANTPIQPEGTTQRLNEFDKVYIGITSQAGAVELGDFNLDFTHSEFARLSRKLQGAHVVGEAGRASRLRVDAAGAAARGLFRSQDIPPIDGVQGPYRLEGEAGEQFIIVIAGSESVFLDGVLLTRGETNDYVIDYATGEISFTPNRIVTADRRITVEFQYSTNQFSRTLVATAAEAMLFTDAAGDPRAAFGVTFLREADGDVFNDEFGLSAEDSLRLIQAGDGQALRSGAEPVVFDPEAPYVQYLQEIIPDSVGGADTIFVAVDARPADSVQVYRVRFTRVGAGNGQYLRVGRGVNGILYEYRGAGLGEYDPVLVLPRPKNQNLLAFQSRLEPIRGVEVFGEWARSFFDQNRLSAADAADDVGNAYVAGGRIDHIPVDFGAAERGSISAEYRRRLVGQRFTAFNRIRPVEFGRRWNLGARTFNAETDLAAFGGDEVTDEASVEVRLTPASFVRGEAGWLNLGDAFDSRRALGQLGLAEARGPQAEYRIELIASENRLEGEEGDWLRQRGRLAQPLFGRRFTPYLEMEQERREQRAAGTDSLTLASLAFLEFRPGIGWAGERLQAAGSIALRDEEEWAEGVLRDAARATTYQTQFNWEASDRLTTEGSLGYRVRRFTDYFRTQGMREDNESLILRSTTQYTTPRRAVDVNLRYEAATERTPTLQEIYIRTGPELGQFVWEDVNADGVLQIDEFLPERTPNEGTYVRTYVPSDSLSSVIGVGARLRLRIDPSKVWRDAGPGWQRALAQVSTQTLIDLTEKSRDPELARIYLLDLSRFRSPVNTVNGRIRIAQDIFLFRSNPRFSLDIRFNQTRGHSELAAGEEVRFLNSWSVEGRSRLSDRWALKLAGAIETNRLESAAFASRRYNIEGIRIEPEIAFSPTRRYTFVAGGVVARKEDTLLGRDVKMVRIPLEIRYAVVRKLQVTTRSEVALVRLTGEAVGLAQFELTDGRGAGTSWLWGLQGDYTVSRYLRLSFSYDGRAPADAPVLHTMRVQLSALF
ncbi:MAG: hypothetical protein SH809_11520 [Rhodothermales bacterium]|nr:hypothetical protein [Rhodothermales bacterium]